MNTPLVTFQVGLTFEFPLTAHLITSHLFALTMSGQMSVQDGGTIAFFTTDGAEECVVVVGFISVHLPQVYRSEHQAAVSTVIVSLLLCLTTVTPEMVQVLPASDEIPSTGLADETFFRMGLQVPLEVISPPESFTTNTADARLVALQMSRIALTSNNLQPAGLTAEPLSMTSLVSPMAQFGGESFTTKLTGPRLLLFLVSHWSRSVDAVL